MSARQRAVPHLPHLASLAPPRHLRAGLPVPLGRRYRPPAACGHGPPDGAAALLPARRRALAVPGRSSRSCRPSCRGPWWPPRTAGSTAIPGSNPRGDRCAPPGPTCGPARWSRAPRPSPCRSPAWPSPGPRTLARKLRESFRALQLGAPVHQGRAAGDLPQPDSLRRQYRGDGDGGLVLLRQGAGPLSLGEIALLTALPRSPVALRSNAPSRGRTRGPRPCASPARGARRFPPGGDRRGGAPARSRASAGRPPFAAPHFSEQVRARYRGEARIHTTLDRRLQTHRREAGGPSHPRAARPGDRQCRRGSDRESGGRMAGPRPRRLGRVSGRRFAGPGQRRRGAPLARLDPQALPLCAWRWTRAGCSRTPTCSTCRPTSRAMWPRTTTTATAAG